MGRLAWLLCLSLVASAPSVSEARRKNPEALEAAMKKISEARLARLANMTNAEIEIAARLPENLKTNYTATKKNGKWQLINADTESSNSTALLQTNESKEEVNKMQAAQAVAPEAAAASALQVQADAGRVNLHVFNEVMHNISKPNVTGFSMNQIVWFSGVNRTWADGDRLTYGVSGKVVTTAHLDESDDKGDTVVGVQFPGNREFIDLLYNELSLSVPEGVTQCKEAEPGKALPGWKQGQCRGAPVEAISFKRDLLSLADCQRWCQSRAVSSSSFTENELAKPFCCELRGLVGRFGKCFVSFGDDVRFDTTVHARLGLTTADFGSCFRFANPATAPIQWDA